MNKTLCYCLLLAVGSISTAYPMYQHGVVEESDDNEDAAQQPAAEGIGGTALTAQEEAALVARIHWHYNAGYVKVCMHPDITEQARDIIANTIVLALNTNRHAVEQLEVSQGDQAEYANAMLTQQAQGHARQHVQALKWFFTNEEDRQQQDIVYDALVQCGVGDLTAFKQGSSKRNKVGR